MTDARSNAAEDVYALPAVNRQWGSRFPTDMHLPRAAYQLVHDELMLDGVSRMNLATFCTTWLEQEVQDLMAESIAKNIVDKDEYPQTAEIERRCIVMLADLAHAPSPESTHGTSTTGSSEAAMLGGLAAKWRWRERRHAAGKDASRPNMVCGSVQVCWEKFARYFDVELRQVPMPDDYLLDPAAAIELCDENTIMVVPTFGQTFTGLFDNVQALAAALDSYEQRTGIDIPIHVDAASGGFVAAFCTPDIAWDFRNPRVKSINLSGHKTGLAPIGVGWALWREKTDLPEGLIFNVNYLGGEMPTFNLNFSRPGGQVIASYYNFIRLGKTGYKQVHNAAYSVARFIADAVESTGLFDIVFDGDSAKGIPAATWKAKDPAHVDVFALAEEMRKFGWQVPAYTLPSNQEKTAVQRAIVRHGFSKDMATAMIRDLQHSIQRLGDEANRTAKPRASFAHNARPQIASSQIQRNENTES